ncbi:MAG: hypothetical protein ACI9TH_002951 [Kiritimatiellia bacterium]|jgi:hypothetical protein
MNYKSKLLCTLVSSAVPFLCLAADEDGVYEGGRGLISLEGPTGLFINPTSGTLPADMGTAQYCIFFPENETDVLGHGLIGAYGVSDSIEIGAQATYLQFDAADKDDLSAVGPFARVRLMTDSDNTPEVSVGGYSRFGDEAIQKYGAFLAASKRVGLGNETVRSLGLHAGVRNVWFEQGAVDDSLAVYGGVEVELPLRLYAVGEITSEDDDINAEMPYAYGIQWRAGGINMSLAGIQNGNTEDVSFYYGIGFATGL